MAHHRSLIPSLELHDGPLRHQKSRLLDRGPGANPGKLAGPEEVSRIGEEGCDLDRARPYIDLAVGKGKGTFVGVDAPVGEYQLEGDLRGPCLPPLHVGQVLLLTHGYVDLEGIDARDGGQLFYGAGTHEVAELGPRNAGDPVDGRDDPRESEVEPGLVHHGLGRDHGRVGRLFRALGIIEVFLADGVLLHQGLDAFEIGPGRLPPGPLLRELALRLLQCRLKGAGVDPEEDLPLLDEIPLSVIPGDEVALDLRTDCGVDEAVGRGGPFRIYGYIPPDRRGHLHHGD